MASVYDVAAYILEKRGAMTALKLEKLAYYSQAWFLAWNEIPLFDEEFEAWANGPVCRELYLVHRGQFLVDRKDLDEYGNASRLTEAEIADIDLVLEYYGDKEPYWLSNLTHLERPWKETREKAGCAPGQSCDEVIPKELMQEYYSGL